jgi:hypothetical protein
LSMMLTERDKGLWRHLTHHAVVHGDDVKVIAVSTATPSVGDGNCSGEEMAAVIPVEDWRVWLFHRTNDAEDQYYTPLSVVIDPVHSAENLSVDEVVHDGDDGGTADID